GAGLDTHRTIDDIGAHLRRAPEDHIDRDQAALYRTIDDRGLGLDGTVDRAGLTQSELAGNDVADERAGDVDFPRAGDIPIDAEAFTEYRGRAAPIACAAEAIAAR